MEQFRPIPEGEKQKQTPQQRGEGIRGVPPPEEEQVKPQQESAEGQSEPADLNVSSADTVHAGSSEVGKDKPPLKRRRSLAFAGPRISDELLRISENKKP
jgi:hypothetical protein